MSGVSDEELTAYLDGEASPEEADRLERAAADDPRLRRRLEALSLDTAALRAAFDPLLDAAPSPPEMGPSGKLTAPSTQRPAEPVSSPPRRKASLRAAAAAGLCLVIGGLAGGLAAGGLAAGGLAGFWRSAAAEDWRDLAAAYHALYTAETLSGPATPNARRRAELSRASAAVGLRLAPEVIADVAALTYRRAQLLGHEGAPIAQIAYLSAAGEPVALCLRRRDAQTAQPTRLTVLRGMPAAFWARDGVEFLLIGGGDPQVIAKAAAYFEQRL